MGQVINENRRFHDAENISWDARHISDEAENSADSFYYNNIPPYIPKFCTCCGTRLEDDDSFCTECGAKIELLSSESEVLEDIDDNIAKSEKNSTEKKQISSFSIIPSDRMASIAETTARKLGSQIDIFQNFSMIKDKSISLQQYSIFEKEQKNILSLGTYVHKVSTQTMYMKIESVTENNVRVSIKTIFDDGSYGIENYTGTLCGNGISLHLSDYDLHTMYSFKLGESFLGVINENSISGKFSGEFSGYCVFRKC